MKGTSEMLDCKYGDSHEHTNEFANEHTKKCFMHKKIFSRKDAIAIHYTKSKKIHERRAT